MKLTQTGLPLSAARLTVPPPTFGSARAGAGSPMCKSVSAEAPADAEAPGAAEPGAPADSEADGAADPDGTADGLSPAAADADATGLGLGEGVAAATGTLGGGLNSTMAPRTRPATATPATRPATIDRRGHMAARVPVRAVGGVPAGPLLRFRSDVRSSNA